MFCCIVLRIELLSKLSVKTNSGNIAYIEANMFFVASHLASLSVKPRAYCLTESMPSSFSLVNQISYILFLRHLS